MLTWMCCCSARWPQQEQWQLLLKRLVQQKLLWLVLQVDAGLALSCAEGDEAALLWRIAFWLCASRCCWSWCREHCGAVCRDVVEQSSFLLSSSAGIYVLALSDARVRTLLPAPQRNALSHLPGCTAMLHRWQLTDDDMFHSLQGIMHLLCMHCELQLLHLLLRCQLPCFACGTIQKMADIWFQTPVVVLARLPPFQAFQKPIHIALQVRVTLQCSLPAGTGSCLLQQSAPYS